MNRRWKTKKVLNKGSLFSYRFLFSAADGPLSLGYCFFSASQSVSKSFCCKYLVFLRLLTRLLLLLSRTTAVEQKVKKNWLWLQNRKWVEIAWKMKKKFRGNLWTDTWGVAEIDVLRFLVFQVFLNWIFVRGGWSDTQGNSVGFFCVRCGDGQIAVPHRRVEDTSFCPGCYGPD